MFDMFDLVISSHPHILISLGICTLACILASSHPYIFMFECPCLYRCILTSSILRFMCPRLHPCIFIFLVSCVLASNLLSSHPLILGLVYSMCLLVSSHPHLLISLSCNVHTCLGNWNQIKTMVLTKKNSLHGNN